MISGIQSGSTMSTDMMAQMREKMFAKLDPDGDGQIDLSKLQAEAAEKGDDVRFSEMVEHLTAADTDGDGMVSQAEFEQMEPPARPDGPPPGEPPGSRPTETSGQELSLLDYLYAADGTQTEEQDMLGLLLDTLG
jgi:hypothetical protein